jgi:prepilin-type N-terminal cleavage/methylation domain-containing protein
MSFLRKKARIPDFLQKTSSAESEADQAALASMVKKNHRDLAHSHHAARSSGGFTLIEMLIVIVISTMLSAIAISYSSISRNEVALSVESTKITQIILEAKSLSVATYGNLTNACGFGVSFDAVAQTYSIFAYHPSGSPSCPPAAGVTTLAPADIQLYSEGTWNIHVANGVVLSGTSNPDRLYDVLFYPPEPATLISRDGSTFLAPGQTSRVYLTTADGNASATISVSPGGQVEL